MNIKEQIKELFPTYDNQNGITMSDLWKVCKKLNIGVYSTWKLKEWIAWLIQKVEEDWKDKISIFLNSNNSESRNKFTIAHELWHFILHMKWHKWFIWFEDEILYKKDWIISPEEKQANEFAAELLMPENRVIEIFWYYNIKFEYTSTVIEKMVEIFWVSKSAMVFRLTNLSLI
jgi:Zn-dependent peptidase ImmA (M78 family)